MNHRFLLFLTSCALLNACASAKQKSAPTQVVSEVNPRSAPRLRPDGDDPASLLARADEFWSHGKKGDAAALYTRLCEDFKLSLTYALNKDRIKDRSRQAVASIDAAPRHQDRQESEGKTNLHNVGVAPTTLSPQCSPPVPPAESQADGAGAQSTDAVSVRAVAPSLPGGLELGLNVQGMLTVDAKGTYFRCSKETVNIPHSQLVSAKTRVEGDLRLWFFTYVPTSGASEEIFIVSYPEDAFNTEALRTAIVNATGFEKRDGVPGGVEFRRPPSPCNSKTIASGTTSSWSEFDRRVESTAPTLSSLEPSITDLRSVNVSLSMVYDDNVDVGQISLMYVGDDWLWLAQEITVALPGDESMRFSRSHSDVVQGGTCVEIMTSVLDRPDFEKLASDGFAMEVPQVGVVRVPAYHFEGLIKAFDTAKTEHGIVKGKSGEAGSDGLQDSGKIPHENDS